MVLSSFFFSFSIYFLLWGVHQIDETGTRPINFKNYDICFYITLQLYQHSYNTVNKVSKLTTMYVQYFIHIILGWTELHPRSAGWLLSIRAPGYFIVYKQQAKYKTASTTLVECRMYRRSEPMESNDNKVFSLLERDF